MLEMAYGFDICREPLEGQLVQQPTKSACVETHNDIYDATKEI
jgi:hypothetical protein